MIGLVLPKPQSQVAPKGSSGPSPGGDAETYFEVAKDWWNHRKYDWADNVRTISSCALEKTKDGLTTAYYNIQTKIKKEPKKFPYASARASPRDSENEGRGQKIKSFVKNTGESVLYYGQGIVELIKSSERFRKIYFEQSINSYAVGRDSRAHLSLSNFLVNILK